MAIYMTTVNAEQAGGLLDWVRKYGWETLSPWVWKAYTNGDFILKHDEIMIDVGDGKFNKAKDSDWLIQHKQGEISIMSDDNFRKVYQRI